jgi:Mce-associated membrane protein
VSRPTPKRPTSSRAGTTRPRKLAGQASTDPTVDDPTLADAPPADAPPADAPPADEPLADEPPADEPPTAPDAAADQPAGGSVLDSPRVTRMLLSILGVLVLLLLLQAVWFARHIWFVDAPPEGSKATGAIAVPADRPVVEDELSWKEGADVAGRAMKAMLTRSFDSYDKDVDAATVLMTDSFAEQFRDTTDSVKDQFIAKKAVMSADVQAQAVVRANDAELQALVFVDQSTTTSAGPSPKTVHSGYRALVTLVHTDEGWFVDRLDAK